MQTSHRNPSYRYTILFVLTALLALILSPLGTHPAMAAGTWQTVGLAGFSTGFIGDISIVVNSSGEPYVTYQDSAHGSKVTVMKFDGTSWGPVGQAGFSAGGAGYISLAFDLSNTPYVAYSDGAYGNKATVMKFDGTSWGPVGQAGFSAGTMYYTSLAIDASGTPYVAYTDGAYGFKATVMKFDGTNWVLVGPVGFSAGSASYPSLAINASGTPYVAYTDGAYGSKATVMKFDGTNWAPAGPVGFSAGGAYEFTLAIDASGTPYLAYTDGGNGFKATVMKFDGTNWAPVGVVGFSAGKALYISLAIDASGTPYLAYQDDGNINKATLMKFDRTNWVPVGPVGFSAGTVGFISVSIDANSGTPYVAYYDGANGNRATVMKYPMVSLTTATAGNGSGTVSPAAGVHAYEEGSQVTLSANASIGSTFTGWSGDPACASGPVTITANLTCTATFTLDTFTLAPSAGANGSISPAVTQTVNYGGSLTFTITPDDGYAVKDVSVDGVSQGALSSYTFSSVINDHTLAATFELKAPSGLSADNDGPTALGATTALEAFLVEGAEMTYAWDFGDGQIGSGAAVTHTYAAAGMYTAKVTASNAVDSLQAETTVYVTTNPIARAESTQTARPANLVSLDGSASTDPGNFLPLTYLWKQTGGPAVTLAGADTAIATFNTPAFSQTTTLTFELMVTNAQGLDSQPRVVTVTVEPYQIFLPIILK